MNIFQCKYSKWQLTISYTSISTESVSIELLDLPDNCLIEIVRRLALHDLASIALTCQRLKAIAERTFTAQIADFSFRAEIFKRVTSSSDINTTAIHIDHCLKQFGHLLTHINYSPSRYVLMLQSGIAESSELIFYHLVRHCGATLQSLRVNNWHLIHLVATDVCDYFHALKKLVLNATSNGLEHYVELKIVCIEINVRGSFSDRNVDENFVVSKVITIDLAATDWFDHIEWFIVQHKELKLIKISAPRSPSLIVTLYRELCFRSTLRASDRIKILNYLRRCRNAYSAQLEPQPICNNFKENINGNCWRQLDGLISAAAGTLEHLEMNSCYVTGFYIQVLAKCRALRTLKLNVTKNYKIRGEWSHLEDLKQLSVLHLIDADDIITNFLGHLGSTITLKYLSLTSYSSAIGVHALGRFSHLRRLHLKDVANLVGDDFNQLQNLRSLVSLKISQGYFCIAQFLQNLGSTQSLKCLEVDKDYLVLCDNIHRILGRFRNLSVLRLGCIQRIPGDVHCDPAAITLNELTVLRLDFTYDCTMHERFLSSLSTTASLRVLEITSGMASHGMIRGICQFHQLHSLRMDCNVNLGDEHFSGIFDLNQLTEFRLNGCLTNVTIDGIYLLIEKLPKLQFLQIFDCKIVFDEDTGQQLNEICAGKQKRMIIEYGQGKRSKSSEHSPYKFCDQRYEFVEIYWFT